MNMKSNSIATRWLNAMANKLCRTSKIKMTIKGNIKHIHCNYIRTGLLVPLSNALTIVNVMHAKHKQTKSRKDGRPRFFSRNI